MERAETENRKEAGVNEYKCAQCHNIYEKGWSDEDAAKESEELFLMPVTEETHAIICDDCFKMIFGERPD